MYIKKKLILMLIRCCEQGIQLLSLIKCRATIIALRSLCEQDLYFLGTKAMGLSIA